MSPRCCLTIALLATALLAACAPGPLSETAATPPLAASTVAPQAPTIAARTPASGPSALPATPLAPTMVAPGAREVLAALKGEVLIDGSSTVFPITEAVAIAFRDLAPRVALTLGVSGTGGGFRRFCAGETTISDASRPITADEAATCAANGIDFVELPVAYDGLSLVVNAANSWATCLTTAELRRIWGPESGVAVRSWHDVRADWPDLPITFYGPGADSGTFDYFTTVIVGQAGQIRAGYTASEDDYLLAQDIVADPGGLGFFGYAYLVAYEPALRAVAVDNGAGCVAPTGATITSGSYHPLSRPLFIYVRADALDRPEVAAFVSFYLLNARALVAQVSYIPLPPAAYERAIRRADARVTGSMFDGDVPVGISIEELLDLERNP